MTDRYEKIRKALAMGPTPGPWYGDDNSVSCLWSNGTVGIREYIALPDSAEDSTPNPANMHFIAACDPDTIRELLVERDALAAEVERLRADRDSWAQQASDRVDDWYTEHLRAERLAGALEDAEEAMRFVYTACATAPQEPQHIQNAAWGRIVNALAKARAALGRGG